MGWWGVLEHENDDFWDDLHRELGKIPGAHCKKPSKAKGQSFCYTKSPRSVDLVKVLNRKKKGSNRDEKLVIGIMNILKKRGERIPRLTRYEGNHLIVYLGKTLCQISRWKDPKKRVDAVMSQIKLINGSTK